jgi:hypothetical protein
VKRVLVLVAAVVVVVASVVGVRAATGAGTVDLPPVSPDRLAALAAAGVALDPSFSGTLHLHFDLGVPSLGDAGPFDTGPLAGLLGDQTVRVWRSPLGARVAFVESSSERDLYLGRDGAWSWDFSTLRATRLAPPGVRTGLFPLDLLTEPNDFRGLLDGLRPTTRVAVEPGARVAGRPVYPLVLEPRTNATLVGRVEVDVDASQHLPLAVRVFPRGSNHAAIDIGFTSIGFGSVDPATFDFSPPPGAHVVTGNGGSSPLGLLGGLGIAAGGFHLPGAEDARTFGHGWGAVVAVRVGGAGLGPLDRVFPLSGPLLSAREVEATGGAWVLVGAVPQSTLERVGRSLG